MTNTREEIADTAIELMGYKKGYQDGIRHVAGLVEVLERIAKQKYINHDASINAAVSYIAYIAQESLNNLPDEIRQ